MVPTPLKRRRPWLRRLVRWLVIAAVLYGVHALWVWYLFRPPHYTFNVPPVPTPNALDDFHRAADAVVDRDVFESIYVDRYAQQLMRVTKSTTHSSKKPIPRADVAAFLRRNTGVLRLIRLGLTHRFTIPAMTRESSQHYNLRYRDYENWHFSCRKLLEINALYCKDGNDPHATAAAYLDLQQYQRLTVLGEYPFPHALKILQAQVTRLSVNEARDITARLAGYVRLRRSYAEKTEQQRAAYLNYITACFSNNCAWGQSSNRWFIYGLWIPSPMQDRGVMPNLWFAYTVPDAQVPARADRYLTACITAARQPCSSHARFPSPPPDDYNYNYFGWDEREKSRVEWALHAFYEDALLMSFALEGYRHAHGTYPATLQALVADGWVKSLPVDTFTFTDTICYQRTGSTYRLYSRGPDGKDDGGKPTSPNPKVVGPNSTRDVVYGITTSAEDNSNSGRL